MLGLRTSLAACEAQLVKAMERIAKLEALAAQASARQAPVGREEIEVRRLILRDAHGIERAVLETLDSGQTCLRLCDDHGLPRVWISAGPDKTGGNGSVISVLDAAGVQRVSLGELETGQASLLIHDTKGNGRANVAVSADDSPHVALLDAGAEAGVYLAMEPDGTSALQLGPAGSAPLLVAAAGTDGSAGFRCFDKRQNLRAELSNQADGAPGVYLLDPNRVFRAVLGSIKAWRFPWRR